jgi:hypothetical protein
MLQYFDLNLPINKTQDVSADGTFVYYYSGSTPSGLDPSIILKAGTGAEVILKPGQSIRLAPDEPAVSTWKTRQLSNLETITGKLLIGTGDFNDANINNIFKLDATFANQVTVTNDAAHRVPVTLDTTQTLNVAGSTVAYTTSYASTAASVGGTPIQLLAPATNVNGVVLNKFELISNPGAANTVVILAKNGAPASITDGDVLWSAQISAGVNRTALDQSKDGQIKVPAGKGIYYLSSVNDVATLRDALFTVL